MPPRKYADLADLPEDERITLIGQQAEAGDTVAFFVEDDAKAERYFTKLLQRHKVRRISKTPAKLKGVSIVIGKIGPRVN